MYVQADVQTRVSDLSRPYFFGNTTGQPGVTLSPGFSVANTKPVSILSRLRLGLISMLRSPQYLVRPSTVLRLKVSKVPHQISPAMLTAQMLRISVGSVKSSTG
jgi:hypothetical protein